MKVNFVRKMSEEMTIVRTSAVGCRLVREHGGDTWEFKDAQCLLYWQTPLLGRQRLLEAMDF